MIHIKHFVAAVSLTGFIGLCVSAVCPLPRRVTTEISDGYIMRKENTRSYKLLAIRDWGIYSEQMNACSRSGGKTEKTHKFGFVAVIDTEVRECRKLR